ncbi:MAG: histidine phosphatase family protein [Candidatus Saccharibacteria bacterium]|nr:histidine phosphatase family protein [Candidatus Saccharibacteria bacterium]
MKITYFVHSITKDNENGIATGWLDSSLSAEGIRRAEDLHERIKHRTFDAIYTSDLKRAIESADIFFGKHIPKNVDQRLRECNYGSFDGKPVLDFKKGREQEYIDIPYPDGESYLDVEVRIKDFLNDAAKKYPNGHIAIVAHQAPQLALEVLLNHKTWKQSIETDWRKTQAWQPGWEYTFSVL